MGGLFTPGLPPFTRNAGLIPPHQSRPALAFPEKTQTRVIWFETMQLHGYLRLTFSLSESRDLVKHISESVGITSSLKIRYGRAMSGMCTGKSLLKTLPRLALRVNGNIN
jgi:hypothetical protein